MKYLNTYLLSDKETVIFLMSNKIKIPLKRDNKILSYPDFQKFCPTLFKFKTHYVNLFYDLIRERRCRLLVCNNRVYVTWDHEVPR